MYYAGVRILVCIRAIFQNLRSLLNWDFYDALCAHVCEQDSSYEISTLLMTRSDLYDLASPEDRTLNKALVYGFTFW